MALTISAAAEAAQAASLVLKPRVIACVAGAYADGSEHCLSLENACAVIRATRGNAFVIHIPRPDRVPRQVLPIEALFDAYEARGDVVPLVNTSRARTASEALAMIRSGRIVYEGLARHFQQPQPLFKLEVLGPDLTSLDDEVLRVMDDLPSELHGWVMPLVSASEEAAAAAASYDPPAVRLLVGRIGSDAGPMDVDAAARAVERLEGIPAVAEGGIATPAHVAAAARFGAAAVLANSAFHHAPDPGRLAAGLRAAADRAWPPP